MDGGDITADYKERYLTMIRQTEKGINILVEAQKTCEELYLNAPEIKLVILPEGEDHPEK